MSEIKLTDEDLLNYLENNDFSRTSEADQLEIIAEQQLLDSVDDQTGAPFLYQGTSHGGTISRRPLGDHKKILP